MLDAGLASGLDASNEARGLPDSIDRAPAIAQDPLVIDQMDRGAVAEVGGEEVHMAIETRDLPRCQVGVPARRGV